MTTRFFSLSLSFGLALAPAVRAGEAPSEITSEVKTAGFHLQNRSSFTAPAGTRAPFWPIGRTPQSKRTTSNEVAAPVMEVAIKAEQFNVTSILLGSQSLAVINGRTYGEGEYLKTPRARPVEGAPGAAALPAGAKVRVMRITDGFVTLQAGGQSLSVPLKRAQLQERKSSDDELLSQVGEG